jgi:hypothetical protein
MKKLILFMLLIGASAMSAPKEYAKAKVSFSDFKNLVNNVEDHRAKRLVDLDTFLKMSKQPNTIILDSRSRRFDLIAFILLAQSI